jgi:transcriptional regulator with XRE-family HTH domain
MSRKKTVSALGQRLKALRQEHGWTLAYVGERSGISKSTLSKLENGQTNLNFTSVTKLAEGLALPVSALTNPATGQLGARRSLTRLGGGTQFEEADARFEILCSDLADKSQSFMRLCVTCHDVTQQKKWHSHPGQEFLYVLAGTLVLYTQAYEPLTLKSGDSIVFDSAMGHKYVSKGRKDAELLITMQTLGYSGVD